MIQTSQTYFTRRADDVTKEIRRINEQIETIRRQVGRYRNEAATRRIIALKKQRRELVSIQGRFLRSRERV